MVNLLCFLHLHKGWKLFPHQFSHQFSFNSKNSCGKFTSIYVIFLMRKMAVLFTGCMVIAWLLHGVCMMIAWWLQKLQGLKVVDRYVDGEPPDYLMNLLTPSKAAELYSNWCSKFQEQNSSVNPGLPAQDALLNEITSWVLNCGNTMHLGTLKFSILVS